MAGLANTTVAGAILALSVTGAQALDVGAGAGASGSVGLDSSNASAAATATGRAGTTGNAAVDTPNAETLEVVSAAMARGEAVVVLSSDGSMLGTAHDITMDTEGATLLSIALDHALDASVERATFRGSAELDGNGQVVLPMTQAAFLTSLEANAATTKD